MEVKEYTERKLPNVLVLGKIAQETPSEEDTQPIQQPIIPPIEPEPEKPEDPEPLPEVPEIIIDDKEEEMEEKKVTIVEQIARLIDVKSIITFMLIGTLCYLAVNGKALDQQFMTIVTAVTTFYFSYKVQKNGESK
jgi:hypothetical protein